MRSDAALYQRSCTRQLMIMSFLSCEVRQVALETKKEGMLRFVSVGSPPLSMRKTSANRRSQRALFLSAIDCCRCINWLMQGYGIFEDTYLVLVFGWSQITAGDMQRRPSRTASVPSRCAWFYSVRLAEPFIQLSVFYLSLWFYLIETTLLRYRLEQEFSPVFILGVVFTPRGEKSESTRDSTELRFSET